MNRPSRRSRHPKGFTLVELTIVLVIVALLTSGMIISFSTQKDITDSSETLRQLNTINDALLGFAATNQRLPCPAAATSAGLEQFCESATTCAAPTTVVQAHGRCSVPFPGFLPAATLGVAPTDGNGFAVDRWNNRIRYAVTQRAAGTAPGPIVEFPFTAASTVTTGLKAAWPIPPAPDIRVCRTATGISGTPPSCAAGASLTDSAVAVVFSTGKNGGVAPTGADELANWVTSNDRTFVSMTTSGNFDDIVVWLSPNLLYNRLIASGRLP